LHEQLSLSHLRAWRWAKPLRFILDDTVIDAKRKDYSTFDFSSEPGRCLSIPTARDILTGIASDAKVVIGEIAAIPPCRRTYPTSPAEAFGVSRSINEAITEEAYSHFVGTPLKMVPHVEE
jgi:hypothetical protein